ncbi:hypothetical protein GGI05_002095 [Coemansia sp. RSA 2603]|nr:hypothetical protein GGI05_002095 [Coemansia sp. RSA 2603]
MSYNTVTEERLQAVERGLEEIRAIVESLLQIYQETSRNSATTNITEIVAPESGSFADVRGSGIKTTTTKSASENSSSITITPGFSLHSTLAEQSLESSFSELDLSHRLITQQPYGQQHAALNNDCSTSSNQERQAMQHSLLLILNTPNLAPKKLRKKPSNVLSYTKTVLLYLDTLCSYGADEDIQMDVFDKYFEFYREAMVYQHGRSLLNIDELRELVMKLASREAVKVHATESQVDAILAESVRKLFKCKVLEDYLMVFEGIALRLEKQEATDPCKKSAQLIELVPVEVQKLGFELPSVDPSDYPAYMQGIRRNLDQAFKLYRITGGGSMTALGKNGFWLYDRIRSYSSLYHEVVNSKTEHQARALQKENRQGNYDGGYTRNQHPDYQNRFW